MPRRSWAKTRTSKGPTTRHYGPHSLADLHELCTELKAADQREHRFALILLLIVIVTLVKHPRPMMRITWGLFCALAMAVACSSTDHGGQTPDAATGFVCGDGVCAAGEVNNCPQDCGQSASAVCGNGQCETSMGESQTTCPTDCGGGSGQAVCGNGTCESTETSTSCPTDCAGGGSGALNCSDPNTTFGCLLCTQLQMCVSPYDAASCAACGGGGSVCNNDGVCDPGETSAMCPLDNCP